MTFPGGGRPGGNDTQNKVAYTGLHAALLSGSGGGTVVMELRGRAGLGGRVGRSGGVPSCGKGQSGG